MKKCVSVMLLVPIFQAQNMQECKNENDKVEGCMERWFYFESKKSMA